MGGAASAPPEGVPVSNQERDAFTVVVPADPGIQPLRWYGIDGMPHGMGVNCGLVVRSCHG